MRIALPWPLLLLAAMLAVAIVIEGVLFGRVLGASKLPLALLLGLALARSRRGGARR
jgi:hypothetical protein